MKRAHHHNANRPKGSAASASQFAGVEIAAPWPVLECLVSAHWRDTNKLITLLVAKKPPVGSVLCCAFLLDLMCLGVKNAFVNHFQTRHEYKNTICAETIAVQEMTQIDFPLAAKLLLEARRYAEKLGFEPTPDVIATMSALGPLDAIAATCQQEIPLGDITNGMPHFISGPNDDVDLIMDTLERTCGPGKFHATVMNGSGFF